jgi:hypothetical protein
MARLSLDPTDLFKYAAAASAAVNDLYNSIRTWTVSSLRTDSLKPRSVDYQHTSNHLLIIASAENLSLTNAGVGSPCLEIPYVPSGTAGWRSFSLGFVWPRNGDGMAVNPGTGVAKESFFLDWYNSDTAAWTYDYQPLGGIRTPWVWGLGAKDRLFYSNITATTPPWPGYPAFEMKYSGGPCAVTSMVVDDDTDQGQHMSKIGLWGRAGRANWQGKAALWTFASDRGI